MNHRIIIAGMRRAGTHWVFNAVRLLCEQQSPGDVWAGQFDNYAGDEPQCWHIVKIHHYCHALTEGAMVLTSFRAIPAVMDSYERMTGTRPTLGEISEWVWDLLQWQRHAALCLWYPRILKRPADCLWSLAQACELGPMAPEDMADILQQLAAIKPPPGPPDIHVRDPVTLLFQGHMTQ